MSPVEDDAAAQKRARTHGPPNPSRPGTARSSGWPLYIEWFGIDSRSRTLVERSPARIVVTLEASMPTALSPAPNREAGVGRLVAEQARKAKGFSMIRGTAEAEREWR